MIRLMIQFMIRLISQTLGYRKDHFKIVIDSHLCGCRHGLRSSVMISRRCRLI